MTATDPISGFPGGTTPYAEYQHLEALLSMFHDLRQTHLVTVERLMGHRPGTGGTSGVAWLRRIADHRFFPELWSVRTLL